MSDASRENGAAAVFLLAAVFTVFTGCGYIGDTKPPTLDIPSRVTDLRGVQYGSKIAVEFTIPQLTTEGLDLKDLRSVELRVSGNGAEKNYAIPAKGPGPVSYDIPADDWVGKQVTLMVHATGPKGKTSEWSNPVALKIGTPLPAPENVQASNAPQGVRLTWQGSAAQYRIFRATGDAMPEQIGQTDKPEYNDATAGWGASYRYYVQAVADQLRQSETAGPVAIVPKDVFPPAVPQNVAAVAGVDSIELSWDRNTEDDFAGYNVYRVAVGASATAAFQKIAGPIDIPTYSDRMIEAGKKYGYAITAIDTNGNESAKSTLVEVIAQ